MRRKSPIRLSPVRSRRSPVRACSPVRRSSTRRSPYDGGRHRHHRCRWEDRKSEKGSESTRSSHKSRHGERWKPTDVIVLDGKSENSPVSLDESYLQDIDGKSILDPNELPDMELDEESGDPSANNIYYDKSQTTAKVEQPPPPPTCVESSTVPVSANTSASTSTSDADDRLKRLELMVEMLVASKVNNPVESVQIQPKGGIPELIPRNTNYTTSTWLNQIHEAAIQRNLDENSTLQFMQSRMTGIIKAWFKTVSNYDFTWPELKLLIINLFPDNKNFAETLNLLVKRTKEPGETMTQYFFSKMYLLEACKITGENAVCCLIHGLSNQWMKQEASSFNFTTPESLYSDYLSKLPPDFDRKEEREPQLEEAERQVIQYDEPYILDEDISKAPPHGNEYRKPLRCYTCDKRGHSTAQCRFSQCYICSKQGHIAADCKYKHEVMLCRPTGEPDNNLVDCEINGLRVRGCLDSGSSVITIKQTIAESLQLVYLNISRTLHGFGGSAIETLGEADVMLAVDAVCLRMPVLIVPDEVQLLPVVIGRPLLFHKDVFIYTENHQMRVIYQDQIAAKETFGIGYGELSSSSFSR